MPRGLDGAVCQVRLGTASGENATDRIRTLRGGAAGKTWRQTTRDVRLSGLHAHLREDPARPIQDPPQDGPEEIPSQVGRPQDEAETEHARRPFDGRLVAARRATR